MDTNDFWYTAVIWWCRSQISDNLSCSVELTFREEKSSESRNFALKPVINQYFNFFFLGGTAEKDHLQPDLPSFEIEGRSVRVIHRRETSFNQTRCYDVLNLTFIKDSHTRCMNPLKRRKGETITLFWSWKTLHPKTVFS